MINIDWNINDYYNIYTDLISTTISFNHHFNSDDKIKLNKPKQLHKLSRNQEIEIFRFLLQQIACDSILPSDNLVSVSGGSKRNSLHI